jgi:hypothetical protein
MLSLGFEKRRLGTSVVSGYDSYTRSCTFAFFSVFPPLLLVHFLFFLCLFLLVFVSFSFSFSFSSLSFSSLSFSFSLSLSLSLSLSFSLFFLLLLLLLPLVLVHTCLLSFCHSFLPPLHPTSLQTLCIISQPQARLSLLIQLLSLSLCPSLFLSFPFPSCTRPFYLPTLALRS